MKSLHRIAIPILLLLFAMARPAEAQQKSKLDEPTTQFKRGLPLTPLKEVLDFIATTHKVKIDIDEAAFKKADLKIVPAKPEIEIWPVAKIKLGTALDLISRQLVVDADKGDLVETGMGVVFMMKGDRIILTPGRWRTPADQSKTSPLTKLLRKPTDKFKGGFPGVRLQEAVGFFDTALTLPVVVDFGSFRVSGQGPNDLKVTLAPSTSITPGDALKQMLRPLGASFVIRTDHILIYRSDSGVPGA